MAAAWESVGMITSTRIGSETIKTGFCSAAMKVMDWFFFIGLPFGMAKEAGAVALLLRGPGLGGEG